MNQFLDGNLSIESLRVQCPSCGQQVQSLNLLLHNQKPTQLMCPVAGCGQPIENAALNLKYYCGTLLPDSSAIQHGTISRELRSSALLENFTVLMAPVVRIESDTPRGKPEFHRLRQLHETGRIKLVTVDRVADVPKGLSNSERDERIIDSCLQHKAILLTGDKSMAAFAVGRNVFTIFEETKK